MASRLGVVGDPVEHSRSPQLHLAAYASLGLDWSYERVRVPVTELASFVGSLDSSWRGLSVTMPLKGEAHDLAMWRDDASLFTGVSNTLVKSVSTSDSAVATWDAFNTDIAGIEDPLRRLGFTSINSATIVGAGATASSALVALSRLRCINVDVAVRDVARARTLRDLGSRLSMEVRVHQLENLQTIPRAELTISTVPGAAGINLDSLAREPGDVLFDIAYDVWPSRNSEEWMRRGGRVLSGLSMLAAQALIQVRLFVTGSVQDELAHESRVRSAMNHAVGLDESGLIVRSIG